MKECFMNKNTNSIFTDAYIEKLIPKDQMYRVWDSKISGFGCRVFPTGRKVYMYQYRTLEGKKNAVTIGKHGLINASLARKKVSEVVSQIFRGVNPQTEKKAIQKHTKESIIFRDFWRIFEERHISQKWGPHTKDKYKSMIQTMLCFFGNKKLDEITREVILSFDKFLQGRQAGRSIFTKTYVALLRPLFNLAEVLGHKERHTNPCHNLPRYTPKKVGKILSEDEIKKFLNYLDSYEAKNPQVKAAIYLYLYCGFREGELLKLKWEDVEIKDNQIYFKQSKSGEKILPLHQTAVDVFHTIPKKEGNPYIFYGRVPGKPLTSVKGLWTRLKQQMNINMRLHDLRHTFITHTLRRTDNLALTSKLAGHKNIQTTMRYVHLAADKDLRKGIDQVESVFKRD